MVCCFPAPVRILLLVSKVVVVSVQLFFYAGICGSGAPPKEKNEKKQRFFRFLSTAMALGCDAKIHLRGVVDKPFLYRIEKGAEKMGGGAGRRRALRNKQTNKKSYETVGGTDRTPSPFYPLYLPQSRNSHLEHESRKN